MIIPRFDSSAPNPYPKSAIPVPSPAISNPPFIMLRFAIFDLIAPIAKDAERLVHIAIKSGM